MKPLDEITEELARCLSRAGCSDCGCYSGTKPPDWCENTGHAEDYQAIADYMAWEEEHRSRTTHTKEAG